MFKVSFGTVKKYISCLFVLKKARDPKIDHDSKTDFPFYICIANKYIYLCRHCEPADDCRFCLTDSYRQSQLWPY